MRGASFFGVAGAAGAAGAGEVGAPGAAGASTAAVGRPFAVFGFVVVARGFDPVVIAATHEPASSYAGCRRAGRSASPGSRPA